MWYWNFAGIKSKIYFSASQACCNDLVGRVPPRDAKLVRIINIPSFPDDMYLNIPVRWNYQFQTFQPDISLSYRDREDVVTIKGDWRPAESQQARARFNRKNQRGIK